MTTLREKIDGLFHGGTNLLDRDVVLRIIDEHERQQTTIPDITPGGPRKAAGGQGGGAREGFWQSPSGENHGTDSRPGDVWVSTKAAEVEQMAGAGAEVQPWRRELERLLIESSRKNLCLLTAHRLDKLKPLAKLAAVIESGQGDAVVPEGVAQHMPIEDGGHHPAGPWEPWGDRGDWAASDRSNGLYTADKEYILTAINAYGNALVQR